MSGLSGVISLHVNGESGLKEPLLLSIRSEATAGDDLAEEAADSKEMQCVEIDTVTKNGATSPPERKTFRTDCETSYVSVSDCGMPMDNSNGAVTNQDYIINKTKWKEAALYVTEGEKDAKIYHHPTGYWSKKAFKILHHPVYYVIHLIVSILLMFVAAAETLIFHNEDSAKILSIQSSTELVLLGFFAVDIIMRFIWLGPRNFFKQGRTLLITFLLIVMSIETFIELIRQREHPRFTKALRPVFFIDSHYLFGVRRVMRQILLCAKPITDVLLLILFFIVFFSLLGYYFFSESDPSYYSTFWRTFVSLFITMTTANNPDVMLEVFYEHPVSVLFFLAYLVIVFYYLMNVLLAVVYGSYEEEEKKKFKKLFKHKLSVLDRAYDILATKDGICFQDFLMFMHYFQPTIPKWQVMCMFKTLHKGTKHQNLIKHLSREEFFNLHDVRRLRWKQLQDNTQSYLQLRYPHAVAIHRFCNTIVKSKAFNVIINLIVLLNLLFLVIFTIISSGTEDVRYESLEKILPASYIFISIYVIEIVLRIVGVGPLHYFRKKRNILDFVVILISFTCLLLESKAKFVFLASVRPFKLIRLLRLKRRYRDITNVTILLIPRLVNVGFLLMVVYYFFASIGIEFLSGVVYEGCCNTSWYGIGSSYSGIYFSNTTDNFPASSNTYYILNFDTITNSYVTLFVLMVVNNWYIIMEGFASEVEASWLVRVYFISFFIVMLVILQVVISFIVDEFKFKVLDTAKERVCPQHGKPFEHCKCKRYRKKVAEVTFEPADVEEIEAQSYPSHRIDLKKLIRKLRQIKLYRDREMKFIGRRLKTKDDVKLQIFQSETEEWIKEYNELKLINSSEKLHPDSDSPKLEQKTKFDRVKSVARQCILYFVDWVIE